jgi:hypothetical protein
MAPQRDGAAWPHRAPVAGHYNKGPRTAKWRYADPCRHIGTGPLGTSNQGVRSRKAPFDTSALKSMRYFRRPSRLKYRRPSQLNGCYITADRPTASSPPPISLPESRYALVRPAAAASGLASRRTCATRLLLVRRFAAIGPPGETARSIIHLSPKI